MNSNNNSSPRNQAIENYIQRVTELTQLGNKALSNQELVKIASELGISDEEIAIAQQQSQAHFLRAQGYYNLAHWDEAINELEEALAFNPFHLPMLHLLVKSYLGRWQQKHNRQDEEQIKLRIKQCLEIQPDDQESLKLLSELDKLVNKYKYQIWGLSAFFLVVAGSFLGLMISSNVSLDVLLQREDRLEKINQQLTQQIKNLQEEQILLYNQILNQNREQKKINQQYEFQIQRLENEIKNLNLKQQELLKKINESSTPLPFENFPPSQPRNNKN